MKLSRAPIHPTFYAARTGVTKADDGALINRLAPIRYHALCAGIGPAIAQLSGVKTAKRQPHRPWPVGRGWICLRCSHYEPGDRGRL